LQRAQPENKVLLSPSWNSLFSFLFVCLFVGIGVWTQGFALARQVFYCLSHTPSPFNSDYFAGRVSLLAQADLGWRVHATTPSFFLLKWGLWNFLPNLGTVSQVARITGMSYWYLAKFPIFDQGPQCLFCFALDPTNYIGCSIPGGSHLQPRILSLLALQHSLGVSIVQNTNSSSGIDQKILKPQTPFESWCTWFTLGFWVLPHGLNLFSLPQ
jgi:hypothetical protein